MNDSCTLLATGQRVSLSPEQQKSGMRLAHLAQAFGMHLSLFIYASAICPLFIKKLGGSDLQAMLPATMAGLVLMVQIPVSIFVPPSRGRSFLIASWAWSSLPMAVVLLAALILGPRQATVWIVLTALIATQLLISAGATFWWPILHDVVPASQLGRFFGKLRSIWSLTYFGLSVLAALFLGRDPALWQFLAVFGTVTCLQMVRELFVARIPLCRDSGATRGFWRDDVRYILSHRPILIFGGYFMLLMFLTGFLGQPLVLYMHDLGFSTRDNTMIYAASVLGSVLALVTAGVVMDRIGTRRMFMGVHIVLSALALMIAWVGFLPGNLAKPLMTLFLVMSGAALAVAWLTNTAQIFHMAPASGKAVYMSIMMTFSAAGGATAPFMAGLILDSHWRRVLPAGSCNLNVYQIIFLATGVGLVLTMAFLPFIQNVRSANVAAHEGSYGA